MSMKKVSFDSIVADKKLNHRGTDPGAVDVILQSLPKHGLITPITCMAVVRPTEDGGSEQIFKVIDGFHRFDAVKKFRKKDPEAFEKLFPNGKLEITVRDGDPEELHDQGIVANTHRKQLEPWEIYAEIVRRERLGRDQYETAADLNIQQPRIAEFLSFQKCITDVHEQWRAGVLSHNDMIQFAALEDEEQEKQLKTFLSGVEASGGKKAEARKELKKKAQEGKREYANAGKPSRKKLESFAQHAYVNAVSSEKAADRHFWNAIAAAFKVVNGETDFKKLTPEKEWVSKKEATAAEEFVALEAERLARKAEKAKKEAAAERAAAKASAEKPAKKKAAKKAAKKKSKKTSKKTSQDGEA
jgi:hypothetical protein